VNSTRQEISDRKNEKEKESPHTSPRVRPEYTGFSLKLQQKRIEKKG